MHSMHWTRHAQFTSQAWYIFLASHSFSCWLLIYLFMQSFGSWVDVSELLSELWKGSCNIRFYSSFSFQIQEFISTNTIALYGVHWNTITNWIFNVIEVFLAHTWFVDYWYFDGVRFLQIIEVFLVCWLLILWWCEIVTKWSLLLCLNWNWYIFKGFEQTLFATGKCN
jgi:hypothetical protein